MASSYSTLSQKVSAPGKLDDLIERTYAQLRRIAGQLLKRERSTLTLQPTVLVHELYIRWTAHPPAGFANLGHYFASASRQMHEIVIDKARRRTAEKRGGGIRPLSLEEVDLPILDAPESFAVRDLLQRFREADPCAAQIVQLRIWEGREWTEIAAILDIAESTARRKWPAARAWLQAAWDKEL